MKRMIIGAILGGLVGAVIGANFTLFNGNAGNINLEQIGGRVLEAATQFNGQTLLMVAGILAGALVGAILRGGYLNLLTVIIIGMLIGHALERDVRAMVGPYLGLSGNGGVVGSIVGALAGGMAIFSPLARKLLIGVFLGGSLAYAVSNQMEGSRIVGAILGALIAVAWAWGAEMWQRRLQSVTSDDDAFFDQ